MRKEIRLVKTIEEKKAVTYREKCEEAIYKEMGRIRLLPQHSYDYKYGLSFIYRMTQSLTKLVG